MDKATKLLILKQVQAGISIKTAIRQNTLKITINVMEPDHGSEAFRLKRKIIISNQ